MTIVDEKHSDIITVAHANVSNSTKIEDNKQKLITKQTAELTAKK